MYTVLSKTPFPSGVVHSRRQTGWVVWLPKEDTGPLCRSPAHHHPPGTGRLLRLLMGQDDCPWQDALESAQSCQPPSSTSVAGSCHTRRYSCVLPWQSDRLPGEALASRQWGSKEVQLPPSASPEPYQPRCPASPSYAGAWAMECHLALSVPSLQKTFGSQQCCQFKPLN